MTYLAMSWGASAIAVAGSLVPGVVDPHGPLLTLGVLAFVATGAWVLRAGRITARAAHPLTTVALAAGVAIVVCVQDPLARCLATGWGLLIPMQMSSSLSRRATAAYGAVCATNACLLVGTLPGSPLVVALRLATVSGLIGLAVLHIVLLRRELDAAVDRAHHLATSDTLTGLLNRRGLAERSVPLLRSAGRRGELIAAVVLDLDHFKRINDTMGHATGDTALVAVAGSLASAARAGDLVVRLGGEEVALLGVVRTGAEAAALAERLRLQVRQDGAPWALTTSAGIAVALADAADGEEADLLARLLAEADRCLYLAKAAGRDRVVGPHGAVSGPGTRAGAGSTSRSGQ
jgi:diguanylate cyclase (GGDEF)-like protein